MSSLLRQILDWTIDMLRFSSSQPLVSKKKKLSISSSQLASTLVRIEEEEQHTHTHIHTEELLVDTRQ